MDNVLHQLMDEGYTYRTIIVMSHILNEVFFSYQRLAVLRNTHIKIIECQFDILFQKYCKSKHAALLNKLSSYGNPTKPYQWTNNLLSR